MWVQMNSEMEDRAEMEERIAKMREWREARDMADRLVRESRSRQPQYILWDLVKKMKIRIEPALSRYEINPNYSRRDPVEDFDRLMRAIKNMRDDGTLPQQKGEPPAIVAIQSILSSPPRWYYVRNDISEGRKKKSAKPKSKRKITKKKGCGCK